MVHNPSTFGFSKCEVAMIVDVRMLVQFLGLLIMLMPQPPVDADDEKTAAGKLTPPFTQADFKKHVKYLASDELAGRAPGTEGSAKAAEYIIEHFKSCGLAPLQRDGLWFQEFKLNRANQRNAETTARNILAVLPGRGALKDQAVILTAHYDHLGMRAGDATDETDRIRNGADDNASGVAAVLMIARELTKNAQSLPESHRTTIIASFDAEEAGLVGARYYARNPIWPLDRTSAVINLDGIGRLRMGKIFASDAETNPMLAQIVRDAAKAQGLVAETKFGGHGRSDHAVFTDLGIPAMQFFSGANIDYHQVTDEWERLNLDGGAKIAWIAHRVLRDAILYPDTIKYEKPDPLFDITFALNLLQIVGIVPVVNAQDGRYPQILFVLPNSPAAEFGLQAGDKFTALNGMKFTRVEDGITIFPQLTFEDGLRISILRGGKNVEAIVPAEFFATMSGPKSKPLDNGKFEVEFRYQAPVGTKAVFLAGEFNSWKPMAHAMNGPTDVFFTTKLELPEGVYEYKFVLEGTNWQADPMNLYRGGKYGNSVLWVGTKRK